MRTRLVISLLALLLLPPAYASELDRVIEEGVQSLTEHYESLIQKAERPEWDINNPASDPRIQPVAEVPRVLAIAQKLGIPHERMFVNWAKTDSWDQSRYDGRNILIAGGLVKDGTEPELAFIIAHEHGHQALNHWPRFAEAAYRAQAHYCPECTDLRDVAATVDAGIWNRSLPLRNLKLQMELEADEWAAHRLTTHGYVVAGPESLLGPSIWGPDVEGITKDDEGQWHPAWNKRLAVIGAALKNTAAPTDRPNFPQ